MSSLVYSTNDMKKKIILVTTIVSLIVLIISMPYIIKRINNFNVDDPEIVNVEFSDKIEFYDDKYQLISGEEYIVYYDVIMTKQTYKKNPNIFIMDETGYKVLSKNVEVSKEKISFNNVKVRYQMTIIVDGNASFYFNFNFVWNLDGETDHGIHCINKNKKSYPVHITLSTIDVDFCFSNELLFTYKAKPGQTLSDILYDDKISKYDGSNFSKLLNKVLNDKLVNFASPKDVFEYNNLEELGFNGWICNDKSYDDPIYEKIEVYPSFKDNGDYKYLCVSNISVYNSHDYFLQPSFYLEFNENNQVRIYNVKYTLYSDSDIIIIEDDKFKITEAGTALITVKYDLGFYSGERTITVEKRE